MNTSFVKLSDEPIIDSNRVVIEMLTVAAKGLGVQKS